MDSVEYEMKTREFVSYLKNEIQSLNGSILDLAENYSSLEDFELEDFRDECEWRECLMETLSYYVTPDALVSFMDEADISKQLEEKIG
jgi:hypothetical protein